MGPAPSDAVKETNDTRLFRVNVDSFSGAKKHLRPAHYNIYTDGSKTARGVGAGVAVYKNIRTVKDYSISLPGNSTYFMAEVAALAEAAKEMSASITQRRPTYVKIYSDSRAALQAVNSRYVESRVVLDAIMALNQLASKVKVTLVWVRAHVGTANKEWQLEWDNYPHARQTKHFFQKLNPRKSKS